jgi:hypothetical protein
MLSSNQPLISPNSSLTFYATNLLDENDYTNVDEHINKLNAQNENINFEYSTHCKYQQ